MPVLVSVSVVLFLLEFKYHPIPIRKDFSKKWSCFIFVKSYQKKGDEICKGQENLLLSRKQKWCHLTNCVESLGRS